ncbi:glycosyltransferase family 2 protein [Demequina zhanjiangensis]|uniref:Glycosyltransferase family 2 protein n=1 Tax=Demequina zhanjiangensis TaxID=3051659 RepID=A0ABT8FXP1_9MICO|nr:glycosyltransferase family 2 protein [Demequina sp. SYSU T00b26]MDN4471673.1 glycosyltransferase family 2 protein [Demequina sp. SYSU T00b26]
MNATRPVVRAILVTDGRSAHLSAALASLSEHEYDTLDVVVVGGDAPEVPPELRAEIVDAPGASYHEAVDAALALHPDLERDYLWLLHDDTAPMPGALAALTAVVRKRRRVAIVGAAQVRWDDPSRLVGMGTTTSRVGARRVALVEEDDVNQGQHDSREDVLAVSLAGALVRRDWWHESGGIDDSYRGFGDSLDLCRRAWRSGYDVVVVPSAKVRHAQDGLHGRRSDDARGRASTYAARRTSEWFHACAYAPALAVPLLVLWAFASAPVRALLRIAQNEPRVALTDLSVPWRLLARLRLLARSRRLVRRAKVVPVSVERPLLATLREVVHHVRVSELGAYDAWRASQAPSDVERQELALAASRRRRGLAVTSALALAVSVALHGDWLASVVRGQMLSGDILGVSDLGFADVWARVSSGWDVTGFGAPALDSSFAALLLPLAALPGGLRLGLGLLLVLAPALAALGVWAAAGTVVRSAWVRGAVALTYGLWPLFLASVNDGRVGAVIAHLVLPWVLFGVVRGAGWHRGEPVGDGEFPRVRQASPSASAGAALAMAVAVAAAPVLLPGLLVAVLTAGAFARGARLRTWAVALPALVVSGPAIVAASGADSVAWAVRVLARDAGPIGPFDPLTPWSLLLGSAPAEVDAAPLETLVGAPIAEALGSSLAVAIGAAVLAAAVVALVSLRSAWAVRALVLLAAAGLGTALVSQHVSTGSLDGVGGQLVPGWPGAGSSLMVLGLLTAAAAAASGAWHAGERSAPLAWRRTGYAVGLGLAGAVLVVDAITLSWPGVQEGDVSASSTTVLPLAIALDQRSETQQRVMVLDREDDGTVRYSVLSTDGTVRVLGVAERDDAGVPLARAGAQPFATPRDLAQAVGLLAGGADGAGEQLAAWGVGVVVIAPGADSLLASLTQVSDLTAIGASDYGTPYRVQRADGSQVSRAWIADGDTVTAVPMQGMSGGADVTAAGTTLVLAEAADDAWQATLDGTPLARVDDPAGRNAWAVAEGGTIEITYEDPAHAWWLWAAAIVCGWVLLASIPLHRARGKEGS